MAHAIVFSDKTRIDMYELFDWEREKRERIVKTIMQSVKPILEEEVVLGSDTIVGKDLFT